MQWLIFHPSQEILLVKLKKEWISSIGWWYLFLARMVLITLDGSWTNIDGGKLISSLNTVKRILHNTDKCLYNNSFMIFFGWCLEIISVVTLLIFSRNSEALKNASIIAVLHSTWCSFMKKLNHQLVEWNRFHFGKIAVYFGRTRDI